jgi:tetratricopeptide (TPR) repeat protein/DNA-binding MarR family transcriptional regulator
MTMARLVVSQNERMLLHLSDLDRFRDDAEVPMAASQEGIAQRLQIQVHNASRALSSLQSEGLVTDRLAHVRGAPRRRRAYFLTENGRQVAQAIRADVSKRSVVLEHDGKVQELPLEEAIRRASSLAGMTPSLTEMIDLARSNDVLTLESLKRPCDAPSSSEFIVRAHGRPKVDSFFGRETERETISDALAGKDIWAILIWGMPGIGKSTLASKLFDELSGKRSMFWYSFREWDTEASFVSALVDFLTATGRNNVAAVAKRGGPVAELFVPLVNDLSGVELMLFLDDVQKPTKQSMAIFPVLLEAARTARTSKLFLMSRSTPPFFSKADSGNLAIELSGLDRDSAWKMAQSLNAHDTVRLIDASHGHPLLISLMARGTVGESKGDVASFIEREVYSTITDQERGVLELLSIFRHPVPLEAIDKVNYTVLSGLRQRALLMEQEDGIWTHDLLREFFSSRLTAAAKATLHRRAATYCEGRHDIEWKLETLYHSVEAGDWESARSIALSNAQELAKEFPEETLSLVSRIPRGSSTPRDYAELLFMRGQLQESLGHAEQALVDFEESLSLLSVEGDADKRALVLETVAKLQSQAERLSESLSAHEKALHIYEGSGDKEGQAREWMNIGGVYRKRGDHPRARDAYSKALSLATMEEDRPAQAACMNNLAMLDWDEGRLRDAEMGLKESVKLAHAVRDHAGEARSLENLADLYRAQLKLGETTILLLESSEAFRRAGEIVEFKRTQAACAASLGEQGRYSEGIVLCSKVLERPELRRRKGLFQKSPRHDKGDIALSGTLIDLMRGSGNLKGAQRELARYTSMADELGDSTAVAKGKLLRALVHEDSGDLDSAAHSLGEAEALLRATGNSEGLIAVHMRRGTVEEKRGNDPEAARHYQEAARHAETVNNNYALELAFENLDSVKKRPT